LVDKRFNSEKVIIPFSLSYIPMRKLGIINFEKRPDSIYTGLEPQYFNGGIHGKGYRVIAYRNDGYVDVYDDMDLNFIKDENFDVAGKGLCERKKVAMKDVIFEKRDTCINISFSFTDKHGRDIVVKVIEGSKKKTNGINLMAPIGSSTKKPSCLPLFFLYDFDFIRKYKTDVELTIDGKEIMQDNFIVPIPKDFQWRYYSRYSSDCHMIEFANAKNEVLKEHHPDSSGLVILGDFEYEYDNSKLKKITLQNSSHPLYIEFNLGYPNIQCLDQGTKYVDKFRIVSDDGMGYISGDYFVTRNDDLVRIELTPSRGWTPVPNSMLTKVMFGKKSVFCNWPKSYMYIQNIDIKTLKSNSYWERITKI